MSNIRKFLVISSYAPPAISGAPLMMYNLLSHFPKDSFVILTSHFGIDDRVIKKGHWLPAKYFFFDTPTPTSIPKKEKSAFQKTKTIVKKFKPAISLAQLIFFFYFPFNIVKRGLKIIEDEDIELLLGYSDYGPAFVSTYILHKLTKKSFFLHFYDLYYKNSFPMVYKILAYFLEPRLFREAEKIFVMNEALQEYYQAKYGREVVVIHNSVAINEANTPTPLKLHSEPYKIVFTGTIYWPQANAIRNLVKAVEEIASPEIEFHLYTPHDNKWLANQGIYPSKKIIFASGIPQEMSEVQKSADILFVPLAFGTRYPLLINTSSPGKTYEYLASGKPILVHAPRGSYISEYAKKHNFALVVDEENIEGLKEAIVKLIFDQKLVKQLVENARKTFFLNHDAATTSKKLQNFFLE